MEDTLREVKTFKKAALARVLILVLMEDTLRVREHNGGLCGYIRHVLILVLMEDTLRVQRCRS